MPSNEEITALMTKGDEFQDLTQSILHNLSNIKTNPSTSKSEFTSTLKSMQQNVITIQNDIKIKMHTLLAVQNSINTSIIPTQMSIDMYIQKFDELNNEISKHTKYATNLVNMLNRVKVQTSEYSAQKDINETPISRIKCLASEKNILKTYKRGGDNSVELTQNFQGKILIVLDKYLTGGLEKHTELLTNFLNCDVVVFDKSIKGHRYFKDVNYTKYNLILWQNTFNIIPEKKLNQTYIYIVHSHCDWWSNTNKKVIIKNNNLIDEYIYVSDSVKNNFEKNILVPKNSYVIENQIEQIENNRFETKGLFVSGGSYNELKGHYELIQEFSKIDNTLYTLEIYGDIHDVNYFNKLNKYIHDNKISNIKLFKYTENYIERLKQAEYFCLFSKSDGCSYTILEAMALNKKIVCINETITFEQIYYYPYKKQNFNDSINMNHYYVFPNYHNFIKKYKNVCLKISNDKKYVGNTIVNDDIDDNILEEDINKGYNITLDKGLSFTLRIKNEEKYILNNIYSIILYADEIIICNNNSTDNTSKIIKYLEKYYDNVFVYEYNIRLNNITDNALYYKSKIGTFYNWCLSKATKNNLIKWDGDFESIPNNLSKMIDKYDLRNRRDKFAIWFSGLTCFYLKYINVSSYYDEYRCFSKLNGFKWGDTNNCETTEEYIRNCKTKFINGYETSVNDIWLCDKAKIVDINRTPIFIEHKDYNDYKQIPLDDRCVNDNYILTKYRDINNVNSDNNLKNICFIVYLELNTIGGVHSLNNLISKSLEYTGCIVKYILLKKSDVVDNNKYFLIDKFCNYISYFNSYNITILSAYHHYDLVKLKQKHKHIKLVGMSHSDISFYNKLFTEEITHYDKIIVINKATLNKYIKLNIKNIILLENNILLSTLKNNKKFDENNIKCLFFSRASYDKNVIMLMQAFDILSQKYNIYLDIYSDFNYTLKYYYNLLVNKKAIRIMNPIENSDYSDSNKIYSLYDIVLLPSVSEGCSLNILESINNEIPILCSKNIGNYEIINDELPMFELNNLSIHDNDLYVYNYDKLLENIGYCFKSNKKKLDILTPDFTNDPNKKILYNNNLYEIKNKIEYTINNYVIVKQNTINLKNKITNKYFNMGSYILNLNKLVNNTTIFIDQGVLSNAYKVIRI